MTAIQRTIAKPASALGIDDYEDVPWAAASEEYPIAGEADESPEPTTVRVYRGDVVAAAIEWAPEPNTNLIVVVDGTLWVDGLIDLVASGFEHDSAVLLYVTKNVSARDIAARIDSVVLVAGTIEAERLILCGGDGNLARIEATSLAAGLVLEWNAHVGADNSSARFWGNESNIALPGGELVEPGDVLRAELLEEGEPSIDKLMGALRSGTPVFI